MHDTLRTTRTPCHDALVAPPVPFRRNLLLLGLSAPLVATAPARAIAKTVDVAAAAIEGRNRQMNYVTTADGVEIFIRTGVPGTVSRWSSTTGGRFPLTIGMRRCCSSSVRDIV